jgi:hypothetical protein
MIQTSSEWTYDGSTVSGNCKTQKPTGKLDRDNLKYDKKRDMYYQGTELSRFLKKSSPPIRGKNQFNKKSIKKREKIFDNNKKSEIDSIESIKKNKKEPPKKQISIQKSKETQVLKGEYVSLFFNVATQNKKVLPIVANHQYNELENIGVFDKLPKLQVLKNSKEDLRSNTTVKKPPYSHEIIFFIPNENFKKRKATNNDSVKKIIKRSKMF